MSSGRLAAVGLGLMALICVAVLVAALLAFTWAIDRASEMFEYKAAHPSSSAHQAARQADGQAVSSLTLASTPSSLGPPGQLASFGNN